MRFTLYIVVLVAALGLTWRYLGSYMAAVFQGRVRWMAWLERPIYRVLGVDPESEQSWQRYAASLVIYSGLAVLVVYGFERLQGSLPLNPQHFGAVSPALGFNTATSFVTNTNWQNYVGESTMSYLTQMVALVGQQFASAAAGMCVMVALIRGLARRNSSTIGNFWVDLVRGIFYILLPIAAVAGVIYIGEGAVQSLAGPACFHDVLNGVRSCIPRGPQGSMTPIKQLGNNGGGFTNANAAHPFENPTAFTQWLSLLLLLAIPTASTYMYGKMVGSFRQGVAVLATMAILFFSWAAFAQYSESRGNPAVAAAGVTYQPSGNMEGKEVRFGVAETTLFNVASTQTSTGSVSGSNDSFTPIGGMALLTGMMLGEVSPGGAGAGMYTILAFAIVAVFIGGLMVGRTPEYLGKKIQAREVKLAALLVLVMPMLVLILTAIAVSIHAGRAGPLNGGPHGFTEILYGYTSPANNNGSAFAGLSANTAFYNVTQSIAFWFGRFAEMIPALALGGVLAAKNVSPAGAGTFRTDTPIFVGLFVGVILIVGALTFFPAVALGPIVEQLIHHKFFGKPSVLGPALQTTHHLVNGAFVFAAEDLSFMTSEHTSSATPQGASPAAGSAVPAGTAGASPVAASPPSPPAGPPAPGVPRGVATRRGLFDREIIGPAIVESVKKLDPRLEVKNPVMFVVLIGTVVTFLESLAHPGIFDWSITIWLFLTVIFANFAEAVAEGRGKAQADTLRKMRSETSARRLSVIGGTEELVAAAALQKGDLVVAEANDIIPSDGEIIEGIASVDESAITGESAPVIRESGGDRSAVTGGTKVLSDRIVVRISAEPGHTFMDRMISLVEGANRQKTPNEIALTILLAALTIIFLPVVVTLQPFGHYAGATVSVVILISLLVCLIPTTIGALLSAIGIAGMDRLVQRNVLAMSGRAVEAAGDTQTLLLDKTGTITLGNRMASGFYPVGGYSEESVAEAAQLASLADETPEGRSIVVLAKERFQIRERDLGANRAFVPFSAVTRMSGLDIDGRQVRKGAADSVKRWVMENGGSAPADLDPVVERISRAGSTPLVVADGLVILGVIELKDVVKQGIRDRFAEMRAMGIRTVMITGDNPLTAAAIASEAGVDDFLAEATPENKLALIKSEQEGGKLVAMTGDGTNDAPALAQADVGVAMNTGTTAAKEAGNMVDLDSNPTKLLDIVEIGKQLLITRGALTTFSIANDVAKYFAIIPVLFVATYPELTTLNIMRLHGQADAVLSAVIFNALIIVALIPLALKGVKFRPSNAQQILRRNIWIYGVGGIIAPFIFIKLIDLILVALGAY